MTDLPASARRIQEVLDARGQGHRVIIMPDSTRTADDAARACGCTVGQIAKSIVFRTSNSGHAVLVVTSGANRVDEAAIAEVLGEKIVKADADFVRRATGFAIGGVPPLGHDYPVKILIDRDLLQYDEIWAAAGTPRAVFRLTPDQLAEMTDGRILSVAGGD